MSDVKQSEQVKVTASLNDKSIRSKERITRERSRTASPQTKFTIRQSNDSPSKQISYEIVSEEKIDENLEVSISNTQTPSVKLHRINSSSKTTNEIDSGLDPMGIDLISSHLDMPSSMSDTSASNLNNIPNEFNASSEKEEEAVQLETEIITSPTRNVLSNTPTPSTEEIISTPKMTREMKNLQKSTHDSKVLTDYLNTSFDSPRIRGRKPKESPTTVVALEPELASDNSTIIPETDKELPLKASPLNEANDSDSTVILRDGTEQKRRKSFSRSRSRAKSVSGRSKRPKSITRMLNDELAAASEKEDNNDDDDMDDMAEVSYANTKLPIENRAPNPPPKTGWDSYCFKCHTDNAVLSLTCTKCKCSYHRHCARLLSPLTPIPKNTDEFACIDCVEIEKAMQSSINKYNHIKIDMHTLKEMLTTILEKIRTYPDRDCFENDIQFKVTKENNQPLIITQMSLKTIEERITNNYYKVSESFLHDIKQLEHNWTIVDRNKTKSLKLILKFVNTEINEMEACVHCYSYSFVVSNWFTAPCKRPHLLIWAKLKGYPYWPAKVMSIDNNKQYADVRFFGAHDRAWVPTSHCIVFSEKDPNKFGKGSTPNKTSSKTQKGIADAMKEKDEYIQHIRERFGFRYSNFRENLDPDNLQKQLENQLPGMKKDSREQGNEKEVDGNQKEKLTLKIVKTPDGTQTIEQKTPKVIEKDRHPLYRVLSKNEENSENGESRVKAIILKRNTQSDTEKSKTKRFRTDDSASETSESNMSLPEGRINSRRKSVRDVLKRKKSVKNVDQLLISPEPSKKKNKSGEIEDENDLLEEVPAPKPFKRSRNKSFLQDIEAPLIVAANFKNVPPGTNEIHSLRESPTVRTKQRSRSFHRSRSSEKDLLRNEKIPRRLSANPGSGSNREDVGSITIERASQSLPPQPRKDAILRRSLSQVRSSTPKKSSNSNSRRTSVNEFYDKNIIIKDEPITDEEEIVERNQVTLSDIADLVNDSSSGKRKTILISTSDNSNDSFPNQSSRARKSFPNPIITRLPDPSQTQQIRSLNAMICIPQVFSPLDTSAIQDQSELSIVSYQPNHGSSRLPNGIHEKGNEESLLTRNNSQRRISVNPSSLAVDYTESSMISDSQNNFPRLIPKPTGVFTSEGNTFHRESGAISAIFSENAHRMTDYFKSLLIDTIGAISSGVSVAENVLLKSDVEKCKQQLHNLKAENQLKLEKLQKEHSDEIKNLRFSYEEKFTSFKQNFEQEKMRLISDIRQQCEIEKQRAIEATKRETKRMTWCSNCTKEARFYCCWNTSYCGPGCQKTHWQTHQKYCTNRNSTNETSSQHSSKQTNTDTPPPQSNVPMAISNRQQNIIHALPLAKQPQQILQTQQALQTLPAATAISPISNTSHTQFENAIRSSQQKPTIITHTSSGQKIIQTIIPHQYIHYQPKAVPPLKTFSSITQEQQIPANSLIVRTFPRINSPKVTLISTSNAIVPPSAVNELTFSTLAATNITNSVTNSIVSATTSSMVALNSPLIINPVTTSNTSHNNIPHG